MRSLTKIRHITGQWKATVVLSRTLSNNTNGNNRNNFGEKFLRKETISFEFKGNKFTLPSVIQDTQPDGSQLGTVIAMHGSPGSHNDFKYVSPLLHQKGIRFIGVNFPGYGLTEADPRLNQDNMERVSYVQALCEHLNLRENLIFMGHSRGTENALKMAALNPEKTVGIVQANYLGARIHRGIRPTWSLSLVGYLWELGWPRIFLRTLLYYAYNYAVNIKVKTGDEGAWALCSMRAEKLELPKQKHFVEMLNKTDIKSLLLYSGKDPLMEREIPKEMAALFKGNRHFELDSKTPDDEIKQLVCGEFESGTQSVAVYFNKDGHFMQKYRARLMADACESILRSAQK
ncbi:hypothetical protein QR680_010071 [Steinernema hermaphroditum]|uniref:AB hydrolase-1 domain-containing protein n=1 Tax=Steinernema hermaphroditum TaxID=289476 RepID=A0AA39IQ31_9BILA|nr:hypothetical protein QR680_010071 [Steinernema hermaphroditum]